jgi:hypothetical protein
LEARILGRIFQVIGLLFGDACARGGLTSIQGNGGFDMKLRMRGNSLRLRLTRSEVATLVERRSVGERVEFPNDSELVYELESCEGLGGIVALFENGRIRVMAPGAEVREWASTDRVGMEGNSGRLTVLIEKDFQCRHGEEDSDAYEGR